MKTVTDQQKIDEFLSRGVEKVFPSEKFLEARLKEGKPLTMYLGIDPTGPTLHLGHAIILRKLRAFQELGHKVILLIGDFTGMIGDPTDKSATRKQLTREEVLNNAALYQKQASAFIRFDGPNAAELRHNSEWSDKLTLKDALEIGAYFTVHQFLERDMFQKRIEDKKPIHLHEFLYPLLQGYDSVAMNVDGEIGGNDQTFNMLAGRDLMKGMKNKEKFVIAMKLLVDPTGKKMGKSEGNMITLMDSAEQMFGKVMSWTDGMIVPGFELLTDVSLVEAQKATKANPRDTKALLAREVVAQFFSEKEAVAASEAFDKLFKSHEAPEDVPVVKVKSAMNILDLLVETKLAPSKSEARRLVDGGGIKVDGAAVEGYDVEIVPSKDGALVQKGKRHFVRVVKG